MEHPTQDQLIEAGQSLARWLENNREKFPTNRVFAERIERSSPWLSKVLRGHVETMPEQAIRIHRVTDGAIPGSLLRPDIWRRPEDVPEPAQEAAE